MTRDAFENAPLTASVIVSEYQLNWPSVEFFLEALKGVLAKGELYVDRAPAVGRSSSILSRLVALERAAFQKGWARNAVTAGRGLPLRAEEITVCDVIVDFRSAPTALELCERTRFGLWSFSCVVQDNVFNALARGDSAVECQLHCHVGDGTVPRIIATTIVQSKHALVPTLTFAFEKSVQLALRELKRLAVHRELPSGEPARIEPVKTNLADFAHYGARLFWLAMARIAKRILPSVRRNDMPFGLRVGAGGPTEFDPSVGVNLPLPARSFCADPFLLERDGGIYCFYEEYSFDSQMGKIAVALLHDDGAEYLGDALTATHHLSFPFVFEHDGEIFMMPETTHAERLEIWRCKEFPLRWELHSTAFHGERLADSVLYRQGDAWWLFTNVSHDSFGDFSSELCLYKVDGPDLTKISQHPLNPIVVGSDVARNGGRVFESEGRVYRFSQDNSGAVYGYGLNLMEITELSETGYNERRIMHLTPDRIPGAVGLHHADTVGGKFVMDVRWASLPDQISPA